MEKLKNLPTVEEQFEREYGKKGTAARKHFDAESYEWYQSQRSIHPGELLKEEIEFRGLTPSILANQMGISYKDLTDILNCSCDLTPTTAMLFEAALNIDAEMLMRIQLDYTMQTARQDKSLMKRLEDIRKIVAVL